jgi:anti-anti-sigma regulatory factor
MTLSTDKDTGALCLAGSLEIYDAEEVRRALLEGLTTQAAPRIDLRQVETCDAVGAQILWSTRRTAAEAGKPIRFENPAPVIIECWTALGMPADFFTAPASF